MPRICRRLEAVRDVVERRGVCLCAAWLGQHRALGIGGQLIPREQCEWSSHVVVVCGVLACEFE